MILTIYQGFGFDIVYSPDDNGYYGQIFDFQGKEFHTTDVFDHGKQAFQSCKDWIENHNRENHRNWREIEKKARNKK